ncbi:methyltransferase domain-containing protein [Sneathiella sp.]|jgi:ubiquinone/menaquinone biosynthesis C-methylase UbiE|uniref:SAM-dependent methyltransferase n=1 Tax=Sneathiella sp. TaxID=1964365 RepID=UPI0039E64088
MSAEQSSATEGIDGKLPFSKKLKLWWEGYELKPVVKTIEVEDEAPPENEGPPTVKGWAVSRQRSVVTLFGDGMTRCIPDAVKTRLTTPMGLNKTMSVAEIGSGLGGFSHWVVDQHEAYVDAYESDPELYEASREMTKMAGLTRYIKYIHCDFEDFQPKLKSANVAYSSEALFCVKNKQDCFNQIHAMMKPEGQFMMSDYMLDGASLDDPALKEWMANEPIPPQLIDVQQIRKMLTTAGFEVSIAEDTTDEYKANVLKAFSDYAQQTSRGAKSGHLHDWVLKEGELWTSRVKAMEAGVLKVFRIYARVPREII